MTQDTRDLLHRYFLGNLSREEFARLEQELNADAATRRTYLELARLDTNLRELALQEPPAAVAVARRFPIGKIAVAAAILVAVLLPLLFLARDTSVAALVSSEYAGWESALPTIPGSSLDAGTLRLKTGLATLRFHSGAEITLDGPAEIQLISTMRAKLLSGAASIHAPDAANGFRLDTPYGHAIDHGTHFRVRINPIQHVAEFEVQEGEVSIHHPSGASQSLLKAEASSLGQEGIAPLAKGARDVVAEGPLTLPEQNTVLVPCKETTIIFNNDTSRLNPAFLMVKCQKGDRHVDRKAFLSFKTADISLEKLTSARLILNGAPTDLGMASTMPATSHFSVYGLSREVDEAWPAEGMKWNDAPHERNGVLVGTFEVPRAHVKATIRLEEKALLEFIRQDTNGEVSFVIVCDTPGGTLVHGFASTKHPEISGPQLQLDLKTIKN